MNDHPVTCSFCDREFDRQSRLSRHIKRKHTQRDPVPCVWPGCGQTFSSVSQWIERLNQQWTYKDIVECKHEDSCSFSA